MKTYTAEELDTIVKANYLWATGQAGGSRAYLSRAYLSGADLSRAYLSGAYLSRAYLSRADLSRADLSGADLSRADLSGADLSGADLSGAYLSRADLSRADLSGADLSGADLSGAYLSRATLPTGEKWEVYLAEVVPALLTAGGKTIAEIIAAGAWVCNKWTNCPMAVAYSTHDLLGVPELLRPRAEQFIQLFDAHLIPAPLLLNPDNNAEGDDRLRGAG